MTSVYQAVKDLTGLRAYYPLIQPLQRYSLPALDIPLSNHAMTSYGEYGAGPFTYQAYSFSGSTFIYDPAATIKGNFHSASAITLLCWAYRTSDGYVISVPIGTGLVGAAITIASGNLVGVGRSGSGDSSQSSTGGPAVSTSTWHFLAVVIDVAGDRIGVRLNDGAMAYTAVTFGQSTWTNAGGTAVTSIGAFGVSTSSGSSFFTGRVCHAGFFTGILDDATLDDIYAANLDIDGYLIERGANTASVTLTGFPASASGIAVDVSVDRDSAPFYSATGQSANGSGGLAIAATGCPLAAGTRTVWIRCTNSDGLAGGLSNNSRAFYSPVEVTVS